MNERKIQNERATVDNVRFPLTHMSVSHVLFLIHLFEFTRLWDSEKNVRIWVRAYEM